MTDDEIISMAERVRASCWVPAALWEDALQVAAEAIWRCMTGSSYRPEAQQAKLDPAAWYYMKARFALRSWVIRETKQPPPVALAEWDAPADDVLDAVVLSVDLAGALRALTLRQREMFIMAAAGVRRAEMARRFHLFGADLEREIQVATAIVRDLLEERAEPAKLHEVS